MPTRVDDLNRETVQALELQRVLCKNAGNHLMLCYDSETGIIFTLESVSGRDWPCAKSVFWEYPEKRITKKWLLKWVKECESYAE